MTTEFQEELQWGQKVETTYWEMKNDVQGYSEGKGVIWR
jgi:hypothetical protein